MRGYTINEHSFLRNIEDEGRSMARCDKASVTGLIEKYRVVKVSPGGSLPER